MSGSAEAWAWLFAAVLALVVACVTFALAEWWGGRWKR